MSARSGRLVRYVLLALAWCAILTVPASRWMDRSPWATFAILAFGSVTAMVVIAWLKDD